MIKSQKLKFNHIYIMNIARYIVSALLLLVLNLTAQDLDPTDRHVRKVNFWTPEGSKVAFGDKDGDLVLRGYNKADPAPFAAVLNPVCSKCLKERVHPWLWQPEADEAIREMEKDVPLNAELLWWVTGSIEDLQDELDKPGGDNASWLWRGIEGSEDPLAGVIQLYPNGVGRMILYQKGLKVGQVRCVSGPNRKMQIDRGTWKIPYRAPKALPSGEKYIESVEHGKNMLWAVCLDEKRAIYWHSGNIGENSHGCMRLSPVVAPILFGLVPDGTPITVEWITDEGDQDTCPTPDRTPARTPKKTPDTPGRKKAGPPSK